jgi:hypothetical protein
LPADSRSDGREGAAVRQHSQKISRATVGSLRDSRCKIQCRCRLVIDAVLQNAWGIAFSPAGSPFWVNDNGTGCSTLYRGDGTKVALQVSIPLRAMSCLPPPAIRLIRIIRRILLQRRRPESCGILQQRSSCRARSCRRRSSSPPRRHRFRVGRGFEPARHCGDRSRHSSSPAAENGAVYKGLVFGPSPIPISPPATRRLASRTSMATCS